MFTNEVFCCSKRIALQKCINKKLLKAFSLILESDTVYSERGKCFPLPCDFQWRTRQFVTANCWYLVMRKRLQVGRASVFLHNSIVRVCVWKDWNSIHHGLLYSHNTWNIRLVLRARLNGRKSPPENLRLHIILSRWRTSYKPLLF